MKLFHAFPRLPHTPTASGRALRTTPTEKSRQKGLEILRLILSQGLLCTPEKFRLYPNYSTSNESKRKFLEANTHHDEIIQSRACFTLGDTEELSKEYKLTIDESKDCVAHCDLFGEFAIGLDPIEARELGIMPSIYYYKHDFRNNLNERTAGLATQIVERLDEIRNVFSILSYIEAKATAGQDDALPQPDILEEMGIRVRYQKKIQDELKELSTEEAQLIFRLFDTDRIPSWNLVDFVEIILALFQTTDSTIEDAPLAFFKQREWRLVHHKTKITRWIGLGTHPLWRNDLGNEFAHEIAHVKSFLTKDKSSEFLKSAASYFDHCWLLVGTKDRDFRDFIREIVVPESCCDDVQDIIKATKFIGKTPRITPLPTKWR